MQVSRFQLEAYEERRAQANRQELVERITRVIKDDGRVEALPGLFLNRSSSLTEPAHSVSDRPNDCRLGSGGGRSALAKKAWRRKGNGHKRVGREPAGCRAAARQARCLADRSALEK